MEVIIETSSSENKKTDPKGLSMLLCFAVQVTSIELSRPSSSKGVLLPTRYESNFSTTTWDVLGHDRKYSMLKNVEIEDLDY